MSNYSFYPWGGWAGRIFLKFNLNSFNSQIPGLPAAVYTLFSCFYMLSLIGELRVQIGNVSKYKTESQFRLLKKLFYLLVFINIKNRQNVIFSFSLTHLHEVILLLFYFIHVQNNLIKNFSLQNVPTKKCFFTKCHMKAKSLIFVLQS